MNLKTTIKGSFTPFVSDTLMEQISSQLSSNGCLDIFPCCGWPVRTVASVFMIGDWVETCTRGLETRSSIDLGGMRHDLGLDVDVPREDKLRPGSISRL